ncbi:hypothetical protein KM043_007989 [Ampulex compressa]|nr:hypothetical protein KM043_007989 [Ampulex compressa]
MDAVPGISTIFVRDRTNHADGHHSNYAVPSGCSVEVLLMGQRQDGVSLDFDKHRASISEGSCLLEPLRSWGIRNINDGGLGLPSLRMKRVEHLESRLNGTQQHAGSLSYLKVEIRWARLKLSENGYRIREGNTVQTPVEAQIV